MAYFLAIDIGNSRTKFGLFKDRELLQVTTLANTSLKKNNFLFADYELAAIIVSSVNSKDEKKLKLEKINTPLLHLSHFLPLPIRIEYETPDTLGKDRIAAAVGAQKLFPNQAVLVIDAGTCVTYDFLTAEKVYLGGAISPGVQLRLKSMNHYTNQLPLLSWGQELRPKSIGNNTISAMLSGVINGLISEMQGFIIEYKRQFPDLKIVLSGGDANFFEKELKNGIFADQNLVLKGLNEILIYNQN